MLADDVPPARSTPGAALRIAVVTPYWRPPPGRLERCIESVQAQTVPVTHFLVADGEAVDLPQAPGRVHVVLPVNVNSLGATPRGIGAQIAFNQGFDLVAMLDADNWFAPDHLEQVAERFAQGDLDLVYARRRIVFPDGDVLTTPDPEDISGLHVDTNCQILSRRVAFLAGVWGMYPPQFGSGEDRLPPAVVRQMNLRADWLPEPTVWYESNWLTHYRLAGKQAVTPARNRPRSVTTHFDPVLYRENTGIQLAIRASAQAQVSPRRDPAQWRIAVVTPLGAETVEQRQACVDSVRTQGALVTHFVVSDDRHRVRGLDQDIRHLALPGSFHDQGNTARGLGAMLAFQLGFDAVAFLDADATYGPGHVDALRADQAVATADLVWCRCRFIAAMSDSSPYPTSTLEDGIMRPTSTLLITRRAAFLGIRWAQLSGLGEAGRVVAIFRGLARMQGLNAVRTLAGDVRVSGEASEVMPIEALVWPVADLFARTGLRLVRV
jgi:hypothetical protein